MDVDDAIWLRPPHGAAAARRLAKEAAAVIAGNAYIADWFSGHAEDVRIIPTAVDTDRFTPSTDSGRQARLVVGWTGTSSTIRYLEAIQSSLARFMSAVDAELLVVADRRPNLRELSPGEVRFLKWTPAVEVAAVQEMDVGLMPLPDDEWSRGKCALKLIQYMACGVPYVASPVGVNKDLLELGGGVGVSEASEWLEALVYLSRESERRAQLGAEGRRVAVEHFSVRRTAGQIAEVFQSVGSTSFTA